MNEKKGYGYLVPKKVTNNQPNFTGVITINKTQYSVAGWNKTNDKGEYIYLQINDIIKTIPKNEKPNNDEKPLPF